MHAVARSPRKPGCGVEIVMRRPRRDALWDVPAEMIIARDGRLVAAFRDDDDLGGLLFRLFQLSSDELLCAQIQLDASVIRAHPYVRDVLDAFIECRAPAARRSGARRRPPHRVPSFLSRDRLEA